MKPNKAIYTVLLCLAISLSAFCQTKRIAHKSHSGKAGTFSRYSAHNFGLPPLQLDSVLKTPAKKVIRYRSYGSRPICDTLVTHPHFTNPAISLDSLKTLYPQTKFIGFEPAVIHKQPKKQPATSGKPL